MHIVMILILIIIDRITFNFQKAFGKHNVSVLIGYNYEDNTNSNLSMSNYDFPTDAYSYNKMEAGMALKRGGFHDQL